MRQTTIEEIAYAVKRAKDLAHETGRIQYIYFDDLRLRVTDEYERAQGLAAKCYPGGRVELRGAVGEQVRQWQEAMER